MVSSVTSRAPILFTRPYPHLGLITMPGPKSLSHGHCLLPHNLKVHNLQAWNLVFPIGDPMFHYFVNRKPSNSPIFYCTKYPSLLLFCSDWNFKYSFHSSFFLSQKFRLVHTPGDCTAELVSNASPPPVFLSKVSFLQYILPKVALLYPHSRISVPSVALVCKTATPLLVLSIDTSCFLFRFVLPCK